MSTAPLLTEVQLRRFKAAFKPDPIKLSAFNVIIGRNGAGKSTLLEALQWLDSTLRRDTRDASDRYFGIKDLVNLRSQSKTPSFELDLTWNRSDPVATWSYQVKVEERDGLPQIRSEQLQVKSAPSAPPITYISTHGEKRLLGVNPSLNAVGSFQLNEVDRAALSRVADVTPPIQEASPAVLLDFWRRAVFLRLSPNRLAAGSPPTRKSFEPILDEEGQTLPALLNELTDEGRAALVDAISRILPGMDGVEVSGSHEGRDTRVHYSLLETMPSRGRAGRKRFPIPAWMLSEGTRRITAILALLVRSPMPSLLCIEEVENGLDPWTVKHVLQRLRGAADRGCQVILTTHSPWLLDEVPMDSIIQVRRVEGETRYEAFAERPEIRAYDQSIPAGTRYVNEAQ